MYNSDKTLVINVSTLEDIACNCNDCIQFGLTNHPEEIQSVVSPILVIRPDYSSIPVRIASLSVNKCVS